MAGTAQGQVSLVQHAASTKARWTIDLAGAELARRTGTDGIRHVERDSRSQCHDVANGLERTELKRWRVPDSTTVRSKSLQLDRCDVTCGRCP